MSSSLREMRRAGAAPQGADALLWWSAPAVAITSVLLAYAVLPIAPGSLVADLSTGLFFFLVVLSPFMVAIMNASWGANSKIGVVATFRAAAHVVAYEVPFGFAVLGPAMMAESLSAVRIVEAQERVWFAVLQPGTFLVYLGAALVLAVRYPFDLPFGGSELAGGAPAPYRGPARVLITVSRDLLLVAVALVGALAFLGGWHGPLLPPAAWTAVKTGALVLLFLALPRAVPRARLDQMLAFSWKVLIPFSLVNIVFVGIVTFAAESLGLIP